jgi:hypothetical protein
MNKQALIEELIDDLCLLSNDGLPDMKSSEALSYISEFFTSKGMGEVGMNLIQNLTESDQFQNPALNKVIQYKTVNGEDAEGKVGNLLRRPKEEDAHQKALKALGGEGSDTYKKAMDDLGGENQPERDIEKEKEKKEEPAGEAPAKEEPPKPSAFDPNTSGGRDYLEGLPDNDPAKPDSMKSDSEKTLSAGGVVYSVGGGYYADSPGGEPKYKEPTDESIDKNDFKYILEGEDEGKEVVKKVADNDGETKTLVVVGDAEKEKLSKTKKVKKKKLSIEQKNKLKEKFSKKSEITENMVSDSGRTLPNGTRVRDILDESGNPIEVNTPEGRKKAAEVIRIRLNGLESKITEAIDNFGETVEVKKWLGEIGEMSALAQILEQDVEAYLLTDSERKNDIVFVKSNGEEGALDTGFLSVKTTLEGEQVNKLGANCKADLEKLSEGAKPIFESTINGKTFNLKPTNVLGSVIDIKSGFFAKFSMRDGVEETKEGKLTKVNPERHPNVNPEDTIDIDGVTYFKDQSSYLKNTSVSEEEINEFFDKEADKFLTNLSKPKKGETNQITDADEANQTKEYLKEMFLADFRRKQAEGKPYSLYDMHETMYHVIGKTASEAEMPIEATTDTMAIEFAQNNINPTVSVIKKEDANEDINAQLEKNKSIADERERLTDLATGCLNIRSRTRAIGNPMRYDGIDNISPIAKKPTEKRTPIAEYVKS